MDPVQFPQPLLYCSFMFFHLISLDSNRYDRKSWPFNFDKTSAHQMSVSPQMEIDELQPLNSLAKDNLGN